MFINAIQSFVYYFSTASDEVRSQVYIMHTQSLCIHRIMVRGSGAKTDSPRVRYQKQEGNGF